MSANKIRRPPRKQTKVNAMSFGHLVKHMLDGDHTCQELADLTGLSYCTVLHYTRAMHTAKACYIAAWEKDCMGRDQARIYKIGVGTDKKREKLTPRERSARYRSKMKSMQLLHMMASSMP